MPVAPSTPKSILKKIPPRIIQDAVGLAIFSCMRSGLWMSGSGGSGILIARKADGTWSPPSGILLHTAALGFVIGVDIYDCILVINSVSALEMFTRSKVTLASDVGLTVGPLVSSGLLENDTRWKDLNNTVLTYLKAKGQYRGVPLDGSLVTERSNENAKFYTNDIDVLDILAGNVRKSIPEIQPLFEAIKAAEGRTDYDTATMDLLSQQPAPGDAIIETPTLTPISPRPSFGVPTVDDPDPFGVIALEMAGLEIREAGTKARPTSAQFEYNPSPTSPVFSTFNRQSVDTSLTRSNRGSYMSNRTQATTMTDAYTQTDVNGTPDTTLSPNQSDGNGRTSPDHTLAISKEPEEIDYTKVDMSVLKHLSQESVDTSAQTPISAPKPKPVAVPAPTRSSTERTFTDQAVMTNDEKPEPQKPEAHPEDERDEDADDEDEMDDEDEPIVYEVATTQPTRATIMSSQVTQVIQAKGALVTIPKRVPPPLPVRSPARVSRSSKSEYGDLSGLASPSRQSFQSYKTDSTTLEAADPSLTVNGEHQVNGDLQANNSEERPTNGHHRHSSSVYTAVEKRLSIASIPEMPPTPQTTTEPIISSADESFQGPHTPKPEDDIRQGRVDIEKPTTDEIKIETNSLQQGAISVA